MGQYTSPQSCALRGQVGKVAGGLGPGAAGDTGLGIRHSFHEQVEVACLSEGWRRWEHLEGGQDCLAWHGLAGGHSWRGGGVLLQGRALREVPAEQLSGISLVKSSQVLLLLLLLIQQMWMAPWWRSLGREPPPHLRSTALPSTLPGGRWARGVGPSLPPPFPPRRFCIRLCVPPAARVRGNGPREGCAWGVAL